MADVFVGMLGKQFLGVRRYRNEEDFLRYYRERGGVGGFFGSLLSSSEFDIFLSLLTGLICLNVLGFHLTTSPVTSAAILLMVFLHFEKHILEGNSFLTSNNFNNYTFHPNRIMLAGQWHRLWTGPMLHTSKLHLFLNMTALVALCHVEARNPLLPVQYATFVATLMGLAGMAHCLVVSKYKKPALSSFTSGFSGVVFALKTVANCYEGMSFKAMDFPLIGDAVTYSLPMEIPAYAQVFCELFMVTFLFPDVSFWSNVGGIVAGFLMVGLQKVLFPEAHFFSNGPRHLPPRNAPGSGRQEGGWMEQVGPLLKESGTTLILLAVITYLLYKLMNDNNVANAAAPPDKKAKEPRSRLEELERRRAGRRGDSVTSAKDNQPQVRMPFTEQEDDDTANLYEPADTRSVKTSSTDTPPSMLRGGEAGAKEDDNQGKQDDSSVSVSSSVARELDVISLEDDESLTFLTDGVSSAFAAAMKKMLKNKDNDVVIHSLTTVRRLIVNAVTKGQEGGKEAAKFRSVRLSNPHIAKCNIDGALDLMTSVGFVLTVDEYDEQFLVYPRQVELPLWLPEALECLSRQARELKPVPAHIQRPQDDEQRRKIREAALNRQLQKKKNEVNKKREGLFAAGMGGGDNRSTFYRGGT